MVTGPDDVRDVLLGKNGAAKGSKKGLIIIDMSTIGPKAAKQISQDLEKYGIKFVDAPVTGSVPKAVTGELAIFVGADESTFGKVKPVLLALGKDIKYMGKTGSGQAVKLINNLLVASCTIALAQGLLLSDAMGLSRRKVKDALENTPVMSSMFMKMKISNIVGDDFKTAFSAANMHKDLRLAVEEGTKSKNSLELLNLAEKLYDKTILLGFGNMDMSSVIKAME